MDLRTDSFVNLGSMYGTKPGFYLLVGPDWKGEVPKGISGVFRAGTYTGMVGPRVYQNDTAEDKNAVQPLIAQIAMYPLAEFDGTMKMTDWAAIPSFDGGGSSTEETRWVFPESFFEQLPAILDDAPPLPGEEARYAGMRALIAAIHEDAALKQAAIDEAQKAEKELVAPLLQFRNWGLQAPHHWSHTTNGAAFGSDYFTRTAGAKSNILVNRPNEAKYFYQDLDENGGRLNARHRYQVTFAADRMPPVKGFWSLTLYNAQHFFEPNAIGRYPVGTKNEGLQKNADGSLTIFVQAAEPANSLQRANWLPAPKSGDFSLYVRTYWPEEAALDGTWSPPAVVKVD